MSFEHQVQPAPAAPPSVLPPVRHEPTSLTGSVPKTPTGRRPSLDLEYELFRDTGGQVPELSQPAKVSDSFPASHDFLMDLSNAAGGAATPPIRSPTGMHVPAPFPAGHRGSSVFISPPTSPHHQAQPTYKLAAPPTLVEPRLTSSFAFPPQPHGAPLSGSAAPDSGMMMSQQAHPPQQQQQPSQQAQPPGTGAFRPQRPVRAASGPVRNAKPLESGSESSSPEPPPPARKRGLPAEEKARVRAEQSRTSSRLYRMRKKAYQQTLESTIETLKSENARLQKDLDAARETIAKMQQDLYPTKAEGGGAKA